MKKFNTILLFLLILFNNAFSNPYPYSVPDEGMWLPLFIERLNYEDMKRLGLRLTAEDIYSVNKSSLKDAIVIFGRGCTGEIISSEGLLLTNHHCGYGSIQALSTTEHDYLKDGFWAKSKAEELPSPGLSVKFLVRMEDVSELVLKDVNAGMNESDRAAKIKANSEQIVKDAIGETHLIAEVKSFYAGNEYYLMVYEEYKDVRFVGAPPSSIGKFGADTDNWMWPRHTGDFSMFRVYMSPDGKPAEYSSNNIPLKPRRFLNVSIKGVKKNDFNMILGNPGTTERYLTSYGVKSALDLKNPSIVKIRTIRLEIMKQYMDADNAVRIQYASKYAGTANYWKKFQGESRGLKRLGVYDEKVAIETRFQAWVEANPDNIRQYGNVMSDFASAYTVLDKYELPLQYFNEAIFRGVEILSMASRFRNLQRMLAAKDKETDKINNEIQLIRKSLDAFFKDYYMPLDKEMMAAMLKMYYENVDPAYHPATYSYILGKMKGDYKKYAEMVFLKSIFTSKDKIETFLNAPSAKVLAADPALKLLNEFAEIYLSYTQERSDALAKRQKAERLFLAALRQMNPDKKMYPDANFTMRLTYGTVQDYFPADAVYYNFYTTLEGVMEKEDADNWEFIVPEKLKQLYKAKDYGMYGEVNEKGEKIMKVCYLTNHDITGGNSGSPVLDADGNLVGLAFDGNWEALSGDIAFEPDLQRTINVDIRYVLFIVDKFAGATNLISEMNIIK